MMLEVRERVDGPDMTSKVERRGERGRESENQVKLLIIERGKYCSGELEGRQMSGVREESPAK
jgi:hypothetical protein